MCGLWCQQNSQIESLKFPSPGWRMFLQEMADPWHRQKLYPDFTSIGRRNHPLRAPYQSQRCGSVPLAMCGEGWGHLGQHRLLGSRERPAEVGWQSLRPRRPLGLPDQLWLQWPARMTPGEGPTASALREAASRSEVAKRLRVRRGGCGWGRAWVWGTRGRAGRGGRG